MENDLRLAMVTDEKGLGQVLRFSRLLDAAMAPLMPAFLRAASAEDRLASDPFWRGVLAGEAGSALLARTGEEVAGMALVTYGRVAHLEALFVLPDRRGRGVGGALVARAKRAAAERGYAIMTLNVLYGNEAAHGLYEKAGFADFRTTMAAEL